MTAPPSPSSSAMRNWGCWTRLGALAYDQDRLDYHSRLVVVATPVIRQVYATGRRLVLLNRHQVSARRGLIVTGAAGTGKTTAVTQLGRNHELLLRSRLGQQAAGGRVPVVYVTVPPSATPKMLAAEFARFAGLPGKPPPEPGRDHQRRLRRDVQAPGRPGPDRRDPQPQPGHPGRRLTHPTS